LKNKPNILVCPLDWGIGHATRCVPIINELLAQHANVIIGASGRSLSFLKTEYPTLQCFDFPGYKFSYPDKGSMVFKMAMQVPTILKGIRDENKTLKKLIKDYSINAIISDNRYGLYSKDIPTVFMTHQVFIQTPSQLNFLNPFLLSKNQGFIHKFDECWIPDFQGDENLSGELSHKKSLPENYHFIGPLSRFSYSQETKATEYKYKILVMLSGPEPQRSILENLLLAQLSSLKIKSAVVLGKTELKEQKLFEDHIEVFSHLESEKLEQLIHDSEIIVSRPGYSTVMDLVALNKKAIFIPTPGQTEQEYLSRYYSGNQFFYSMDQQNIDLSKALQDFKRYNGLQLAYDDSKLKERISKLLLKIKG